MAELQTPTRVDAAALSDAELGEIYALFRQCRTAAAPDVPLPAVAELVAKARGAKSKSSTDSEWLVDGGFARLEMRKGRAHADVDLVVAAHARRRGVGRHLFSFLADQARAAGRRSLVGMHCDEAGAAFAASLGARRGNTILVSTLALPALVRPEPVPGYRVLSWADEPPEELVDSWIAALAAINDAPRSPGIEPSRIEASAVRDRMVSLVARGVQYRVTFVLDPAGEVVGLTETHVGGEPGAVARTAATAVLAEHRRKGLAQWLKAESLAQLMEQRPDVTIVRTVNDETNAGMLAINHAVGFRTAAAYTDAIVDL
jgi:mycothiol synthase